MYVLKQVFNDETQSCLIDPQKYASLKEAQLALHKHVTKLVKNQHLENDVLIEEARQTIIRGDDVSRAGKRVYKIVETRD